MIANGPWMVAADIKGKTAKKSLYQQVAYAPSPGWTKTGQGLIVLNGNAGVASGTSDPTKQAAVIAFEKFATSPTVELQRTLRTGAYWPAKFTLGPTQVKQARARDLQARQALRPRQVPLRAREVRHPPAVHRRLEELLAGVRAGVDQHEDFLASGSPPPPSRSPTG